MASVLDRRELLAGFGALAASAILPSSAQAQRFWPTVLVLAEDWPATEELAGRIRESCCGKLLVPVCEEPAIAEIFDVYAPEAMICGMSGPDHQIITVQAGLSAYGYKNSVYAYRSRARLAGDVAGQALRAVLARLMEREYGIGV